MRIDPTQFAPGMEIREYDPARDSHAVRECLIELQDFERARDPRIPPGRLIADAYLDQMFRQCVEFAGVVLVADIDRLVVGFVAIMTQYRSGEPNEDPRPHGFIPDLVVSDAHRGRGIGRSLLREAEARALQAGARSLQLAVNAGNTGARSLYTVEGFVESAIYLEKPLTRPGAPADQQADEGDVD
jgi:ribosomal protein S18 acetylase RimI-like enzyme